MEAVPLAMVTAMATVTVSVAATVAAVAMEAAMAMAMAMAEVRHRPETPRHQRCDLRVSSQGSFLGERCLLAAVGGPP